MITTKIVCLVLLNIITVENVEKGESKEQFSTRKGLVLVKRGILLLRQKYIFTVVPKYFLEIII